VVAVCTARLHRRNGRSGIAGRRGADRIARFTGSSWTDGRNWHNRTDRSNRCYRSSRFNGTNGRNWFNRSDRCARTARQFPRDVHDRV
jgi:hypothetical protein